MSTATLNWTFGALGGTGPVVSCTFTVLVTRDGINISSFSVTTNASGAASGAYQDPTASPTLTHQYRFTPQMTGCASGCSAAAYVVNWNCSGTAPPPPPPAPPPPPPPPPVAGCPILIDSFDHCGSTAAVINAAPGQPFSFTQNFSGSTSVSVGGTVPPGTTGATTATSGTVSGALTTAGNYTFTVTGAKAGCANCTITVPVQVAASASSVQSIRILQGPSAFTPTSTTAFNAADQVLEVSITGTPGKTFQLTATGTVNTSSGVLTMPPSGVFTFSTPVGNSTGYSTQWGFIPAGGNPVTISNPAAVTITGDTCISLNVTQTATSYTITVTAPVGTHNVPFQLSFGGATFGGSAQCANNNFGVVNSSLDTGGTNVASITVSGLTSPYTAAIKLDVVEAGHFVCGTACQQVNI